MNIIGTNTSGLTTSIWGTSVRTLTAFGTAITDASIAFATLAASTTVTFIPSGTQHDIRQFQMFAGAAGSLLLQQTDGLGHPATAQTVVAGATATSQLTLSSQASYYQLVNNDAANSAAYLMSGMRFNA